MALRDLRVRHEPQTGAAAAPAMTSFIDASCQLSGTLRFRETVQIDGRVEGKIEGDKSVVIGPSADVRADIRCESIIISGKVEGDIHATRSITFHKTAQVKGEMKASGIVVEEGSKFRGCIIIGEEETPAKTAEPGKTKPLASS